MNQHTCLQCGREFRARRSDAKFCSSTCKARHWEEHKIPDAPSSVQKNLRNVIILKNQAQEKPPNQGPQNTPLSLLDPLKLRIKLNQLEQQREFLLLEKSRVKKRLDNLFTVDPTFLDIQLGGLGANIAGLITENPLGIALGGILGLYAGNSLSQNIHKKKDIGVDIN